MEERALWATGRRSDAEGMALSKAGREGARSPGGKPRRQVGGTAGAGWELCRYRWVSRLFPASPPFPARLHPAPSHPRGPCPGCARLLPAFPSRTLLAAGTGRAAPSGPPWAAVRCPPTPPPPAPLAPSSSWPGSHLPQPAWVLSVLLSPPFSPSGNTWILSSRGRASILGPREIRVSLLNVFYQWPHPHSPP